MKIVHILEEQKVFFAAMDPFEYLDRNYPMPRLYLGAVEEVGGRDVPVGLMICHVDTYTLVLQWLYVDPKYRGKGYGDELLSDAFVAARNAGRKYISAYLSRDYGRSYICPDEDSYLKMHGFTWEEKLTKQGGRLLSAYVMDEGLDEYAELEPADGLEETLRIMEAEEEAQDRGVDPAEVLIEKGLYVPSGEFDKIKEDVSYTYKDIAQSPLLAKKAGAGATALGELSLAQIGRCMKTCLASHPYDFFDGQLLAMDPTWFDPELSSCHTEGDKVTGLLLIHKEDAKTYRIEYLYDTGAKSQGNLLAMLSRSAHVFMEQADEKAKIIIRVDNPEVKSLTDGLLPKKKGKATKEK